MADAFEWPSMQLRAGGFGLALLVLVATTGCSSGAQDPPAELNSPSPSTLSEAKDVDVDAYVVEALSFIEENGIYVEDIDWESIRASVLTETADASSPEDTHPAIMEALRQAGGRHSFLRPSVPVAAGYIAKPTATESADGVVVVEVPPFTSHIPDHVDEYAAAGARAIVEQGDEAACGWVVDLSQNYGGNMWPMLASPTPLLPDGQVMQFIDRDDNRSIASVSGNAVFLDGELTATADGVEPDLPSRPVAVVQSNGTASSAEAVLLSFLDRRDVQTFGSETAGLATGNVTKTLPDGAVLGVTSSYMATNSGQVFKGPIPPTTPTPQDPVQQAVNWLQSSC
jgi:carboxyl-terminal processing protease